jgi:alpha-glucuronidase
LWFHRVAWDFELASGRTLWQELCLCYQRGVQGAEWLLSEWALLEERALPEGVPEPEHDLEHYRALETFPVAGAPWLR